MEDTDSAKREYEISLLLKEGSESAATKSIMAAEGCMITLDNEPRRIALAYPIKKEQSALFSFLRFVAEPSAVKKLSDALALEPSCLRFLVVSGPFEQRLERAPRSPKMGPAGEEHPRTDTKRPADVVTNEELERKLEEILK